MKWQMYFRLYTFNLGGNINVENSGNKPYNGMADYILLKFYCDHRTDLYVIGPLICNWLTSIVRKGRKRKLILSEKRQNKDFDKKLM